jgi:hypothetical protein
MRSADKGRNALRSATEAGVWSPRSVGIAQSLIAHFVNVGVPSFCFVSGARVPVASLSWCVVSKRANLENGLRSQQPRQKSHLAPLADGRANALAGQRLKREPSSWLRESFHDLPDRVRGPMLVPGEAHVVAIDDSREETELGSIPKPQIPDAGGQAKSLPRAQQHDVSILHDTPLWAQFREVQVAASGPVLIEPRLQWH